MKIMCLKKSAKGEREREKETVLWWDHYLLIKEGRDVKKT